MTASGPWDLGDTVHLTALATDSQGNPVNLTTVTLTITQPDGTVVQPAVTNPPTAGTGQYAVDFVAAQAGHHRQAWVGTGPAWAYTDVFDVLPADPRFLISLADAREALRRPGSDTIDDAELRLYLAAVTEVVEEIAGPQVSETETVTRDGGRTAVLLPQPAVSVTSVTENGVVLNQGSDYVVDLEAGIVKRGTALQPYQFIPGNQNIRVTYVTGGTVIAANVRLAARIILKHLWTADNVATGTRPGLGSQQAAPADLVNVAGYAVPRRAAELLAPSPRNVPGFA